MTKVYFEPRGRWLTEQTGHASDANEQSASGLVPHRLFHESGEVPASSAPRPVLRTPILSESVKDLHCKPDAPYPSEVKATLHSQELFRDYIKKFQKAQEKVTLKEVGK